jgi:multisubunit Na+/H+ antiporter MnhC subunit
MRVRVRSKTIVFSYAFVITAIVVSFAWQMIHGICPVP